MNSDHEQNRDYVAIWRRYLIDWCQMPLDEFHTLSNDLLETPTDILRHEEPYYYIYPCLIDTCGLPWPMPESMPGGTKVFNRAEWFAFRVLRRSILDDGLFNERSTNEEDWAAARSRAERTLATYGFRLADYSGQSA